MSFARRCAAAALTAALSATPLTVASAGHAAPTPTGAMHWKPRPVQYPATATTKDLRIPMSDGTVLRGDLILPASASGAVVRGRFPVIVTITAYNKNDSGSGLGSGLAGGDSAYFVQRGYARLVVDARGTGSSGGNWCAFCAREDKDAAEVMTWAHRQPWSNGATAMSGPSYMGITQLFAAGQRPAGLKAIFPQVPSIDPYRDVVASGGQLDVAFIPLWLGLVTATSIIPPAYTSTDPQAGIQNIASHLVGASTLSATLLAQAATGGTAAYDGPFYAQKATARVLNNVTVPTFIIGGEYDIFQRAEPMIFDNLRRRGVPVKLVIGPWNHLEASAGTGLEAAGYGSLEQLQLRWFDHYVKGMPDPFLNRDIAPLTYYEQGSGAWRHESQYLGADRTASVWRLSGSATTGGLTNGTLTRGRVTPGRSTVLPVPVAGLCTRSTSQWTAGAAGSVDNPCLHDNAPNDRAGIAFQTAPFARTFRFQGPLAARLYVSSPTGDGMLSVAVEDVAPDGTVSRLTGGWQVISLRRLDPSRSRYLDGRLIQPWHPFTQASQRKLAPGQIAPVDVEIFPTGSAILPGHRLRIAIQSFDTPHLMPTLTQVLGGGTSVVDILDSARYPSTLTLPAVR